MSWREVAREIRELSKRLEESEQRIARTVLTGEVVKVEGDMAQLRLVEKDEQTGKPVLSPMVRWANHSGKAGEGLRESNPPIVGEVMALVSPNGEIGKHSRLVPWGPTDESPSPAEGPQDGKVVTIGNVRFALKDGEATISCGKSSITLTDGSIVVKTPKFRGQRG